MYLNEADYLPQSPGALFPGPWLVFAPHPDDESYGMGGAIAQARQAGTDVCVVVVTDGRLGGEGGDLLVARREQEVAHALDVLGGGELQFWCEPDRGLEPVGRLVERVLEQFARFQGGSVFFPSFVEPHPDHRATAVLVWEALRRASFPLLPISYEVSVQGPCNHLIDITPVLERKCRAMAAYASQEAQREYAERVLALNRTRSWSLPPVMTHAEAFQIFPPRDVPAAAVLQDVRTNQIAGLGASGEAASVSVSAVGTAATGSALCGPDEQSPTMAGLHGWRCHMEAMEDDRRRLRHEADQAQAAAREAEAHLQALQASRSWRFAAPLRALSGALRRVRAVLGGRR